MLSACNCTFEAAGDRGLTTESVCDPKRPELLWNSHSSGQRESEAIKVGRNDPK